MKSKTASLCLGLVSLLASVLPVSSSAVDLPRAASGTVELHAHFFMKEGMGPAFHGGFDGPLEAVDYKDRFRSQANPETLDRSGIQIAVVALYAHSLFTSDLRASVRRQIAQAEAFVIAHPGWSIAKTAREAKLALAQGKKILIFSLEGASGIIENDQDIKEFVDEKGIKIITPLHLTDDEFGGVAFLRGIMILSSPIAWIATLFRAEHHEGVLVNNNGLTDKGRTLIRKLIAHHVWIDLAHASDASFEDILPLLRETRQPVLYTHTVLRKYHGAERGLSARQLEEVKKTGGIVGLMPSEDYLETTTTSKDPCETGMGALKTQYQELVQALGSESVMFGSDYNGGVHHLPSGCGIEGLWNIGQVPSVWEKLTALGAPTPKPLRKMVDQFLSTWARVTD